MDTNFWLYFSFSVASCTLLFIFFSCIALLKAPFDRLSIFLVVLFIAAYSVKTLLLFWLTQYQRKFSDEEFVNGLIAAEGNRYLQLV
jgi:hypothetical protein